MHPPPTVIERIAAAYWKATTERHGVRMRLVLTRPQYCELKAKLGHDFDEILGMRVTVGDMLAVIPE